MTNCFKEFRERTQVYEDSDDEDFNLNETTDNL